MLVANGLRQAKLLPEFFGQILKRRLVDEKITPRAGRLMAGADIDHVADWLVFVPRHVSGGSTGAKPVFGDGFCDVAVVCSSLGLQGCGESIRPFGRMKVKEKSIACGVNQSILCGRHNVIDLPQCLFHVDRHGAFHLGRSPRTGCLLQKPHTIGESFKVGKHKCAPHNVRAILAVEGTVATVRQSRLASMHGGCFELVRQLLRRAIAFFDATAEHFETDPLEF